MDPNLKDYLSISISILAFALSMTATVISAIRSHRDKQRAIKKEITDILDGIIQIKVEVAKLFHESAQTDPVYFQTISGILNQQNAFLLQQALYLTDQVPKLVTTIEYNTIAVAAADSGDLINAEKYNQKGIAIAPNNYYRSLALRSYATFLFPQHRFEEARENFRKALILLPGSDNTTRQTNGFTYQLWAWHELNHAAAPERAEELFASARNEFQGIDHEIVRENALKGLERAKGSPWMNAFAPQKKG